MTKLDELEKLADAGTLDDCSLEVKQLIALCRLQHEAIGKEVFRWGSKCPPRLQQAFDAFQKGEE